MSRLNHLPPDLLGLILNGESSSFLIIHLWKCGNVALNARLSLGITDVSIRAARFSQSHFPLLLTQLRGLRSLHVYKADALVKESKRWLSISQNLSHGLEVLRIVSSDANLSLLNYSLEEGELCIETQRPLGTTRYIDMDRLFPRLHTLELGESETTKIEPRDLPGLPSTLTSLKASIDISYFNEDDDEASKIVSKLPRSLLNLSGFISISPSYDSAALRKDWNHAPPLQQLEIYRSSDLNYVDSLPRTISKLKLKCGIWNLNLAQSIPPLIDSIEHIWNIHSKTFEAIGTDWCSAFPKSLTKISITLNDIPAISMRSLPPTIQSIEIADRFPWDLFLRQCEEASISPNQFWPPLLTQLSIEQMVGFDESHIQLLPKTLQFLKISMTASDPNSEEMFAIEGNAFPPNLTKLKLRIGPTDFLGGFKITSSLQSSLKKLKVVNAKVYLEFPSLPDSLTSLSLPSSTYPEREWVLALPSGLRKLKIATWNGTMNKDLPRKLIFLAVNNLLGVPPSDGCMFDGLPTSLENLYLGRPHGAQFKAEQKMHLPNLTQLSISAAGSVSSSILKHLPDSLGGLSVNLVELQKEHIPFIPPRLAWCHIPTRMLNEHFSNDPALVDYWPIRCDGSWIQSEKAKSLLEARRAGEVAHSQPRYMLQ